MKLEIITNTATDMDNASKNMNASLEIEDLYKQLSSILNNPKRLRKLKAEFKEYPKEVKRRHLKMSYTDNSFTWQTTVSDDNDPDNHPSPVVKFKLIK